MRLLTVFLKFQCDLILIYLWTWFFVSGTSNDCVDFSRKDSSDNGIFNNVLQLVLNFQIDADIYKSIYIITQVPYILIMHDLYVRHCWRLSVKLPLCIMVSLG